MASGFQKTVNLKEKGGEIDKLYSGERQEFQKISQPKQKKINEPVFRRVVFFLSIVFIIFVFYFLFFHGKIWSPEGENNSSWYAVKLSSEEIFYGQIKDTSADPVVMANVYYDYDQQKGDKKTTGENNTLRLVKRGGETYGPDGTIEIVRSQVAYMEPLKKDSKVLEAILNYEK
jgi:hypothetical protein